VKTFQLYAIGAQNQNQNQIPLSIIKNKKKTIRPRKRTKNNNLQFTNYKYNDALFHYIASKFKTEDDNNAKMRMASIDWLWLKCKTCFQALTINLTTLHLYNFLRLQKNSRNLSYYARAWLYRF